MKKLRDLILFPGTLEELNHLGLNLRYDFLIPNDSWKILGSFPQIPIRTEDRNKDFTYYEREFRKLLQFKGYDGIVEYHTSPNSMGITSFIGIPIKKIK